MRSLRLLPLLGIALACSHNMSQSAPAPAPLTDANIAAIVLAADNADIGYAQIASALASDTAVQGFARTMLRDHSAVNQAAVDLATKLHLTPVDNGVSLDMRDHAEEVRDSLRELKGAAFDRAYIANEVTYHVNLLAAIDGSLIPGAQNAELKALLVNVRPAVVSHLEHARMLQSMIGR